MTDASRPELVVRSLVGDATVQCSAVATQGRVAIVLNDQYPTALEHAERHLEAGADGVWVCAPECDGS